jgi:SNF2 family DNA or RNA helicase
LHELGRVEATPQVFEAGGPTNLRIYCRVGVDAISNRPLTAHVVLVGLPPLAPASVFLLDAATEAIPEPRVFGMNYRTRIWQEIRRRSDEPTRPMKVAPQSLTKSYLQLAAPTRAGVKTKPKAPSFWDLVYALLQPPLVMHQLENLFFPHALYSFQPAGIEFLMEREGALLADEMGTGKTVQAAVALRLLIHQGRARSAMIVCPVSVLRQWDKHLTEWCPDLLVTVVRGDQETRTLDWSMPAHVYVTSYDALRNDMKVGVLPADKLASFDVVALDEAQYIKNPASGRAKAVRKLHARQRWALTGTPLENRVEDIASIFDFLLPRLLSPFDLQPAALRAKIAPYFLRRLKKDVIKDLPDIIKQEVWLELDSAQRAAYDGVLSEGRTELEGLGTRVRKTDIFRVLTKLKQICNFAPGRNTSPKLDQLLEHVESIVESGQKLIVFSQYVAEGVEKLHMSLEKYGVAKIVGGQSDRDQQIDNFIQLSTVPILVASVRAGGVGLNLQVASYVVHFDHWWNPAVMWQAESRAHRAGQKQTVNVYSYWVADTIEERIFQTLKSKGLLIADVVDGLAETQIDELISTDEWLDMLGVKHRKIPQAESREPLSMSVSEIRERLQLMSPGEFERVVKDLIRSFGYPNAKVTRRTHDGGVDVISSRNTPDGVVRVVAQCKRYKGTVGVEIARALMGVVAADAAIEKGYLVTTGEFTSECAAFCEKTGLVALNGVQTANYVRKFGIGI